MQRQFALLHLALVAAAHPERRTHQARLVPVVRVAVVVRLLSAYSPLLTSVPPEQA
jgi:hypothetical protein